MAYIKGQNPYDIYRKPTVKIKHPHIHKNREVCKILFIILNNIKKMKQEILLPNIEVNQHMADVKDSGSRKSSWLKVAMQKQKTLTVTKRNQTINILRNVEMKCIEPGGFLTSLWVSAASSCCIYHHYCCLTKYLFSLV